MYLHDSRSQLCCCLVETQVTATKIDRVKKSRMNKMEESRCRKFYQNISANPSKSCRISPKIVPTCSPNPPKMVPEASRTWRKTSCSHQSEAFTKIDQIPSRDSVTFGVQLGPKFDENSNKNQCWKKHGLQIRFFYDLDLILETSRSQQIAIYLRRSSNSKCSRLSLILYSTSCATSPHGGAGGRGEAFR